MAPASVLSFCAIEGLVPLILHKQDILNRLNKVISDFDALYDKVPKPYASLEAAVAARMNSEIHKLQHYERAERMVLRGTEQLADGTYRFVHDPMLHQAVPLSFSVEQVQYMLTNIKCPVLLIVASKGLPYWRTTPFRDLFASRIPFLQSVHLEGFHHVHMDAPEGVLLHLASFLLTQRSAL